MELLIVNRKYAPLYFLITEEQTKEKLAQSLVSERLKQGGFYTQYYEIKAAEDSIADNNAFKFLSARKNYEYEGFEIVTLEEI